MELKIEMKDLLKDMKEYTERFEYLVFFHELVSKTHPVLASMVDGEFVKEYETQVPAEPK